MISFKYFFFLGVCLALLHSSFADPADVQNALFSSFTKPNNAKNHDETYQLKVNSSVLCLHAPIELEWTASPDHNSQVGDFGRVLMKRELMPFLAVKRTTWPCIGQDNQISFLSRNSDCSPDC